MVHGKYAISKGTISFGHETGQLSCKPTGTYTFKLTGKKVKKLRFTRVSDSTSSCAGRVAVLAGHFTKVG